MSSKVELAQANIPYPEKGDDAWCIRAIGDGVWLMAVADGLTMNAGGVAARWVIEHILQTEAHASSRTLFADLQRALVMKAEHDAASQTTLTAGVLTLLVDASGERLKFDFFAIGDSPILCLFQNGDDFPYQRAEVHGPPYPAQPGRVYSTVQLAPAGIVGRVAFGSVEIGRGEVLMVCSDGLPQRSVFSRDFLSISRKSGHMRLCDWLCGSEPYSDSRLEEILSGYSLRGDVTDDVTLLVARIPTPQSVEIRSEAPASNKQTRVRVAVGTLRRLRAKLSSRETLSHTRLHNA